MFSPALSDSLARSRTYTPLIPQLLTASTYVAMTLYLAGSGRSSLARGASRRSLQIRFLDALRLCFHSWKISTQETLISERRIEARHGFGQLKGLCILALVRILTFVYVDL